MHLSPKVSRLQDVIVNAVQLFRSLLKKTKWKSPQVIGGLTVLMILISGLTFYLSTTTSAAAIIIDGKQIGLVRNVSTAKNLVTTILKQQGESVGLMAKTHNQITYKHVRVKPAVYLESTLDETKLADTFSCYLEGYKIVADGSVIEVLPSKEDADKVLQAYEDYYVKPSDENIVTSVAFAESISVEAAEVQPDQMIPVDQALTTLLNGKITTRDYTVLANDSWWLIARKNNMLTDEVLAGNPGTSKDTKLQPGQIIKLVNSTPYLTVVSQGTYSGTETIPFDVETKTDNSLAIGQTKTITPGSNGSKLVTYSYVQKNGIDVTKQVLEEEIVQAPVNLVIAKGPSRQSSSVTLVASRGGSGSSSIVDRALSLQGDRYVFGGTTQSGFDCSGFTKYVFSGSGISLPRTSYAQFTSGVAVSKNDLQPGDLVFFTTYAKGASHVGIYIGGGRFVHASNPQSGVIVSSMSDSFYSTRYLGARSYN